MVVAAAIVGIAFAVSSTTHNKTASTATTTTVAGETAADAKLQDQANTAAVKAGCPASPTTPTAAAKQTYTAAPPMTIDTSKQYTATVKTTTGTFTVALDAKTAPITVNNFVFLADKGYFNCGSFFRVVQGQVIQTGNPAQTNSGKEPGYTIPDELPAKAANAAQQYPAGSVAMANTGAPHTGGSQWFIVTGPQYESLSNSYSLFGQVASGMPVVQTISQQGSPNGIPPYVTQRIISVTISDQ